MKRDDMNAICISESEPYMNDGQLLYFKKKLLTQRREVEKKNQGALCTIRMDEDSRSDIVDRSDRIMSVESALAAHRRYCSLLKEIDRALERIENKTFGYCSISGNEIGLRRLEAIPCTSVSIEALEALSE